MQKVFRTTEREPPEREHTIPRGKNSLGHNHSTAVTYNHTEHYKQS